MEGGGKTGNRLKLLAVLAVVLLAGCFSEVQQGDGGATGLWTRIYGSSVVDQSGVYGTKGTADSVNVPGAMELGVRWIDGTGDLWLFGGAGHVPGGIPYYFNDLWRSQP